jgi:hypothetical protein
MSVNMQNHKRYNDSERWQYREDFNEAAQSLAAHGLIRITWINRGVLIDKIHFSLEHIPEFFSRTGAENKQDLMAAVKAQILACQSTCHTSWIKAYLHDLLDEMERRKELPVSIRDEIKRECLFKTLIGLEQNNATDIHQRTFSKKFLGNSKTFEQEVRSRLISVLKRYTEVDGAMSDEEVLAEFGIEKTTSELFLKGPLVIKLGGKLIDLSTFPHGLALDIKTLKEAEIAMVRFSNLLSIENKANFLKAREENLRNLVVFSSGFYSPGKRQFLQKIRDYVKDKGLEVEYYHWGDLDFGGFRIFKQIKTQIFPEVKPYKMDLPTFRSALELGESFKDNQEQNLRKLLSDPELVEFIPLIKELLAERKTLEQEALL